ncbi:tol-pal system-associated acyl-CoA thioesterase [Methylovorus mays]|uniref:tol-pal system-associated acyl-CoA thioesterase n=1 Tax=Methylovorus mays TaxID=184077 RepID=UPI001E3F7D19|nr:tol-pal system-associated acyl-CoA thioesterase [Methylovorus mays]MCB5207919.1 tol-pal system-associated acyl-CoA thioesterase [Methylovorus mays]
MAGVSDTMQAKQFEWPIRVYYEDSDAGGIVYHSQYLNFMERARTEWLRSLGFEQTELTAQFGIIFVVRNIEIKFKKPARFNDAIMVHSQLASMGRSRMVFEQKIFRDGQVLTEASIEVVCIDAVNYTPVTIPAPIQQSMKKMEQ